MGAPPVGGKSLTGILPVVRGMASALPAGRPPTQSRGFLPEQLWAGDAWVGVGATAAPL